MSVSELQKYTYYAKYARYKKEAKRREKWDEAVERMKDMHVRRYPQLKPELDWAFELVKDQKVLGSQRALQFGGEPIERKHARIYNCTSSYCDRLRFFQEAFWLLLCGSGTGFSVQKHHIAKLPPFSHTAVERTKLPTFKYVIPDSIEGWADSLGVLLSSYFKNPVFEDYSSCNVEFDFSAIRPAGSPLSSATGKAPGPKPLENALEKIKSVLDRCLAAGQDRLRPIDAYDLVMHSSDAVLSGGVRRSATICIFSKDDEDMLKAKTGNWFYENPQRARSNNSVMMIRNETSFEEFQAIMQSIKEFGEPGFVFGDSPEVMLNPCCFDPETRLATASGLIKIGDLYAAGTDNVVISDRRVGKGDDLNLSEVGAEKRPASRVILTQRNAQTYRLRTKHGHDLVVTANHKFPTTRGRLALEDMKVGDRILLQSDEGSWGTLGSYEHGLILGLITGDGCIHKNHAYIDVWEKDFESLHEIAKIVNSRPEVTSRYGLYEWHDQHVQENGEQKKRLGGTRLYQVIKNLGIDDPSSVKHTVPECVWRGSREMVIGYLQGFFFADGSVQCMDRGTKTTLSVRLTQSNEQLLQDVQRLLANFGIVSAVYQRASAKERMLPDGKGGHRSYLCQPYHELIINRPNAATLSERVGLFGRKDSLLNGFLALLGRQSRKPERFVTTVKEIVAAERKDVFCLEEPQANCLIANGVVTGNCEIAMWPVDEKTGESGWQACNLSEINGKLVRSKEDFLYAAIAASIIGTVQAGYTDFPYLGEVSERIVRREALLGVSITGMMDSPDILFNPELQREAAALVAFTNRRIAEKMGINPAARATCVKPSGTASCLLGSASGIHAHHARRYFRRVQANKMEACFQHFAAINPEACEDSVWSANKTDGVITFCVEIGEDAKTKKEIDAVTLLKYIRLTQQNWVSNGREPRLCTQPWLQHNVSNTINVRQNEWDLVAEFIYNNRQYFTAVSLLPSSGDKDYDQAPFVAVYTDAELVEHYGQERVTRVTQLYAQAVEAFGYENYWRACDIATGAVKIELDDAFKRMWVEDVQAFARDEFGGDLRETVYCLKDVYHTFKWNMLVKSYKPVNYEDLIEEEDNTRLLDNVACAGGACEVSF